LLNLENLLPWSFFTYLMLFSRIFERTRKRHKLEWRSPFVRSEQVCFRRDRVLTILLTKLFGQLEKCSGLMEVGSWAFLLGIDLLRYLSFDNHILTRLRSQTLFLQTEESKYGIICRNDMLRSIETL